jgi:cytochrome c-type biogenesis protein CcmH
LILAWLVALTLALPQQPSDSLVNVQARELASMLRCPVCQGLSLQDSPSELSQEMKNVIRDQLKAGRSPEQVKAFFVTKYGEWILLRPEPKGFNLAVYILPIVALLGGAGVVIFATRRWTRQGQNPASTGSASPTTTP